MSYYVDIRFRPLASLDGGRDDPTGAAIDRWRRLVPTHDGFVGLEIGIPEEGPAPERSVAAMYTDVRPVDLRTEWASFEHAAAFFGDKNMWLYLCGQVACAPGSRWQGFD